MAEREGEGWNVQLARPGYAGVVTPINDIIAHTDRYCICKPLWKFDTTPIGIVCTMMHHSADGREGTWVEGEVG